MANGDGYNIQILLDRVERGRIRGNQRPPSICRVANVLRGNSPTSFDPQVVSIGPLHRENKKLKESQGLKETYVHDLVQYLESTPEEILKECLQKVYDSMDEIKASYGCNDNISDEDLANMIVMDGCFILEFFRKILSRKYVNIVQDYLISLDLCLLENQIPFFVLQILFDCTLRKKKKGSSDSLAMIVLEVLRPYTHPFWNPVQRERSITNATDSTPDHLLGCLHKFYQPSDTKPQAGKEKTIPSAAELDRSGVNFKAHQDKDYSMTMKFESSVFSCFNYCWGKPTLLVPVIGIGDQTEKILRNFIAYELSLPHIPCYFTSYACAMDMLIDNEEDIGRLIQSKVILNNLGSNKEAADMFNKLLKDVPIPNFYYEQEFKRVYDYYNGMWPKYIAWLRRTYFSNPWSTIALIAAIILFALTIVQTIFAILAA